MGGALHTTAEAWGETSTWDRAVLGLQLFGPRDPLPVMPGSRSGEAGEPRVIRAAGEAANESLRRRIGRQT